MKTITDEDIIEAAEKLAAGKVSAYVVARKVRLRMRQGCGDHSCQFRKPIGMGTNGGCRCWASLELALWAAAGGKEGP